MGPKKVQEGERLERVLERVRNRARLPLTASRGGFEDVERRRRRIVRGRLVQGAAGASAAVLLAIGAWWLAQGTGEPGAAERLPGARAPGAGPVASVVEPGRRDDASQGLSWVAEPGAVVRRTAERSFRVETGTVWFALEKGGGTLEVATPDRTVSVLGTVFAVSVGVVGAAREAEATRVGVLTGRVRVGSREGAPVVLDAGQELPALGTAPVPLDPSWRGRMAELFPERLAAETSAVRSVVVPPGPAAPEGLPVEPPFAVPAEVPEAPVPPEVAPTGGEGTPVEAAVPAPAVTAPSAPPAAGPAPVRYQTAENRLRAGDAAGAAEALESLVQGRSAPSAELELALMDLGRIYRTRLRDFERARETYQRYLDRFPNGRMREEAQLALCGVLGLQGARERERACLEDYLRAFPEGSASGEVSERLRSGDAGSGPAPR